MTDPRLPLSAACLRIRPAFLGCGKNQYKIKLLLAIAELRFGRGGSASEELEYIFGVHGAMYGMTVFR